jgi:hypothetical protein
MSVNVLDDDVQRMQKVINKQIIDLKAKINESIELVIKNDIALWEKYDNLSELYYIIDDCMNKLIKHDDYYKHV